MSNFTTSTVTVASLSAGDRVRFSGAGAWTVVSNQKAGGARRLELSQPAEKGAARRALEFLRGGQRVELAP